MAAEDAEDEAALQRAAARSAEAQADPSPDVSAEEAREQAIQNVLLASEDKRPVVEVEPPCRAAEETPSAEDAASLLMKCPST